MNLETVVEFGLAAAGAYTVVGLLLAVALHFKGLGRIDEDIADAGVVFRLLITPGMVALWPLLVTRWLSAGRSGSQLDDADTPRSSAALRQAHRKLAATTTVVISVLVAIGLLARPGAPPMIAAAGELIPHPLPLPTVVASSKEPFPGLPITINLRTDGERRHQVELVVAHDLEIPDVALFWLAGDGSDPLGEGVFLGTVWGPDRRLFALPPEAFEDGNLVLYSMSHKERVGRFTLPTRGGE